MSVILESLKIAWKALRSNIGRSALTVLGIVIGIASVIIVYSAGEGIRGLIVGQVEAFGTDIINTEIKVPTGKKGAAGDSQSGSAIAQGVQVTTLTLKDMQDINKLANIAKSYAGIMGQDQLSYEDQLRKVSLLGVSAEYINIDRGELDSGRFFDDAEDKSLAQVIVLGSSIKDKLFGDSDPIGKAVKLHKSKYTVIGVMKKKGATGFLNFDDYVYVPMRTIQKKILGINHVMYIISKLKDVAQADETAEDIRQAMRINHDIANSDKDDFRVTTMAEMIKTLGTITNAITLLLLAIVVISLVVGGVGIMNVMYVIVTERISEIGLRKAVGAKFSDIMWQFLVESVLVAAAGGIIGIIIGVIMSAGIAYAANNFLGFSWKFAIPVKAFFVSIGFSTFFGVAFGVYPARRAAKMSPMEALRAE